jgi:hypothetical protein
MSDRGSLAPDGTGVQDRVCGRFMIWECEDKINPDPGKQ